MYLRLHITITYLLDCYVGEIDVKTKRIFKYCFKRAQTTKMSYTTVRNRTRKSVKRVNFNYNIQVVKYK